MVDYPGSRSVALKHSLGTVHAEQDKDFNVKEELAALKAAERFALDAVSRRHSGSSIP